MPPKQSATRPLGETYAISDTGPLISAFQSNSLGILLQLFTGIRISTICRDELLQHGWGEEVNEVESNLVTVQLTVTEEQQSLSVAERIAQYSVARDRIVENHLGEAQAIVMALRGEYQRDLLLLDELAARAVAKRMDVRLSGFPGVLLVAVQRGLISAEELQARLQTCREQGTHYGVSFIRQVYEMAKQDRR